MIYNIGEYIKARRKELGITQEELAEGICEVATLSRIESGKRNPNPEHMRAILDRLGFVGAATLYFMDKKGIKLSQLRSDIRVSLFANDYARAGKILDDDKEFIFNLSLFDQQLFSLVAILRRFQNGEINSDELLSELERLIKVTHPKYSKTNLPKLLSYDEILILNHIAIQYFNNDNTDFSLKVFRHLKNYYDAKMCDKEEAIRTQPMVLYNMSKVLRYAKKYDECISICQEGINLAKETRRLMQLGKLQLNLAHAFYERNQHYDRENSLEYAKQAYYFALGIENKKSAEICKEFILSRFGINMQP